MALYRRETQKSVGFYAEKEFVEVLAKHLKKTRVSKSQFIRDAIAEKLAKEGIVVPEDLIVPLPPYSKSKDGKYVS
ncbi:MAG: ribbon-helix-helix domain-containing protein [Puniceicoccales bacterium]|jgi:hypothetical protein|nr:ribbon-helix-helix domain-containing protein [Puniceicoccales bacterium]